MSNRFQKRQYQESLIDKTVEEMFRQAHQSRYAPTILHLATGAGKTYIALRVLKDILSDQDTALWIAAWPLCDQALKTLHEARLIEHFELYYHGHQGRELMRGDEGWRKQIMPADEMPSASQRKKPAIIFSAYPTLSYSGGGNFDDLWDRVKRSIKLTVIDEYHLAEGANLRQEIQEQLIKRSAILGLTATPHNDIQPFQSVTFRYLAYESTPTYLARPKVLPFGETILKGIDSTEDEGDEVDDEKSNRLLAAADDEARNAKIIETVADLIPQIGKTVLFACTKEHARKLCRKIDDLNLASCDTYLSGEDNLKEKLERFRGADLNQPRILVTVRALAHGIDIPTIKTIIVARPTNSAKLYRQMIGRGCRKIPGKKEEFQILDFTDNWANHDGINSEEYGSAGRKNVNDNRSEKYRFGDRPKKHSDDSNSFIPSRDMQLVTINQSDVDMGGRAPIRLPLNLVQTYGFEFEFIRRHKNWPHNAMSVHEHFSEENWHRCARDLARGLKNEFGPRGVEINDAGKMDEIKAGTATKDHRHWNVDYDGSCGWEVTTPVMRGSADIENVLVAGLYQMASVYSERKEAHHFFHT